MSIQSLMHVAQMPEVWVLMGAAILLFLGIGGLLGLWQARRSRRLGWEIGLQEGLLQGREEEAAVQLEAHSEALDAAQQAFENKYASLHHQWLELQQTHAATTATIHALREQLDGVQFDLQTKSDALADAREASAAANARLAESAKSMAEKEKLFKESSDALKKEFELLAQKVFEQQGAQHQTHLATFLTPFREQIGDFKKRVEEVYHTDTKERASLLTEVRNLQSASQKINTEAANLARALKGDKKLQGNWGELVLERVLEDSGLRKDHEYFVQASRRDSKGDLKRPDVIIRLPDEKDVVVDSKVSLVAYEQALSSEVEGVREEHIRKHLQHLRSHVKRLSEQNYEQLRNVRSLDFVLMFVPIESAFTLAMQMDNKLFTDAFAKRIVIVSPTTLMMTLRIINNVWRYEKQNRNAQEIAERAGALYDKIRLVVEDMEKLGKQLQTVDRTYKGIVGKMTTGRGNLIRQIETFRELGAQVRTPVSKPMVEAAHQLSHSEESFETNVNHEAAGASVELAPIQVNERDIHKVSDDQKLNSEDAGQEGFGLTAQIDTAAENTADDAINTDKASSTDSKREPLPNRSEQS